MVPILVAPFAIPPQIDFTLDLGAVALVAVVAVLLVGVVSVLSAALTGNRSATTNRPRRVIPFDRTSDQADPSSFSQKRRSLAA